LFTFETARSETPDNITFRLTKISANEWFRNELSSLAEVSLCVYTYIYQVFQAKLLFILPAQCNYTVRRQKWLLQ